MEAEARYVRVGLLTLALFALLSAGLYWLSGHAGQKATKRFVVYFQNQSLEGLQINSNVRMQGVNVGKVVDYSIMRSGARKVRVLLQVDARTPVLEGTKAVISRNLVTGLAGIDLESPAQGAPLTLVREGERYPAIPEGVPRLTRVADTLEELGVASRDALARFNSLLSEENRVALTGTLTNLRDITGDMKKTMPAMTATLASLRGSMDSMGALGLEARDVLRRTGTQIDRIADDAHGTLAAARDTLLKMDRQMDSLSGQLTLTADLGSQDIQSTAQSLRQAGDALQDTGRALANPARALYGPSEASLGPGERLP